MQTRNAPPSDEQRQTPLLLVRTKTGTMGHQETVDKECEELKKDIKRLGTQNEDGKYVVKFGVLFDDDKTQQFYEAIVGTLKAARTKGFIDWKGMILLKGAHDDVDITLLVEPEDDE